MRFAAAFLTFACLSACGVTPISSQQSMLPGAADEWRQSQAERDAAVIMQGMAQAQQREQELARSAR